MSMGIPISRKICSQGQGLIELIIAFGIILAALTSIISLTIINVSGQRVSQNELVASNLTREGIESVRNLRDSSRLAGSSFMRDFVVDQTDHTAIAVFDPAASAWSLDFSVNSIGNASLYLHDTNNVYTHDSSGAQLTPFQRLITIDYICLATTQCGNGICEGGEGVCTNVIGQRVTSRAQWNEKGKIRNYQLRDHLYEWK